MFLAAALVVGSSLYVGAKNLGLLPDTPEKKVDNNTDDSEAKDNVIVTTAVSELEISPQEQARLIEIEEAEEERKALDHYFKVSSSVAAISAITMVTVPVAHIIAIPPLIYTLVPMFWDAYEGLKTRQLRPSLIDSIAVGSALTLGFIHLNPLFFMAGAMGVWLYYFSAKLVLKTKDQSLKELSNLFGEQSQFVWLLKEGVEVEIPFEDVQVDDVVVVSAGAMIPVDGRIIQGTGSIDQRMLTGESQPIEKGIDEEVYAATTLLSGNLHITVTKAGKDAVAAQIGEIWNQTADYKTSIETQGEQFSNKAVLPTLGTSAVALATLGPIGATAILLSNFSDAIQLAAPLSTLNFLHLASKEGILIKDGRALEGLNTIDTIVFDKTGTLTLEQPHVGTIHLCGDYDENTLLRYAAAVEVKQTHPVAKAILHAAQQRDLVLPAIDNTAYEIGYGIKAHVEKHEIWVGSDRFMLAEGIELPEVMQQHLDNSHAHGYTLIMVAIDKKLAGGITLLPTIRPEAKNMIKSLKQRDLSLCIISGDHTGPTQALADELGIEQFFAETLPEDKANLIKQLQAEGRSICFIGDGINDTIALKQANVSISLSGAASAATDTAQIIMMDGSLNYLDHVFELSQQFDRNLRTGFNAVLGGSVLCVGGVFLFHFGIFSALALQTVTLATSVGNAFLPKLTTTKALAALPEEIESESESDKSKEKGSMQ